MPKEKIYAAIDLGTSFVRAAIGVLKEDGMLEIIGYGCCNSRGLLKSRVEKIEEAAPIINQAIKSAEKTCKGREYHIDEVTINVGGAGVFSDNIQVSTIIQDKVNKKTLNELEKKLADYPLPKGDQSLHINITGYQIDGVKTADPTDQDGKTIGTSAVRVLGNETNINTSCEAVAQAGAQVNNVFPTILAESLSCLTEEQRQKGVVLVSAGAGSTGAVVWVDGHIMLFESFAVGGDHVTNDLATGLEMSFEDAEDLKKQHLGAGEEKVRVGGKFFLVRNIQTIIQARTNETVKYISNKIKKSGQVTNLKCGVVVVGKAADYYFMQALRHEFSALNVSNNNFTVPEELAPNSEEFSIYSPFLSGILQNDSGASAVLGLLKEKAKEDKQSQEKNAGGFLGLFK